MKTSLRSTVAGILLAQTAIWGIQTSAAIERTSPFVCDATWHAMPVPSTHSFNNLMAVSATSATDAWAAGFFGDDLPGPQQPLLLHWDGSSWTETPGPSLPSSGVRALAQLSPTDAWAAGLIFPINGGNAGRTLIEHWDGTGWKRVKSPSPGRQYGGSELRATAASAADDAWAGGEQNQAGHRSTNLIEHWNGTRWKVVQTPERGNGSTIYGMTVAGRSDAWAIGAYDDPRLGVAQTLALHWDGTAWSVVPTPNASENANWLYSVSAAGPHDAWAIGQYLNFGKPGGDLIEHWDGTDWSIVPGVHPNGLPPGLHGVAVQSGHRVWAVGDQYGPPGSGATFAERWNGTAWKAIPADSPGTDVSGMNAVAVVSSRLAWTAGTYTNVNDGTLYPLIEQYCS